MHTSTLRSMGTMAVAVFLLGGTIAFAAQGPVTRIKYFSRPVFPGRMLNGVFEGSNGDMTNGPYVLLYTISTLPADGAWTEATEISNSNTVYRYLRYRGPGSEGDVAEIEFYNGATKLSGDVFGTPGSWPGYPANDYTKAFDNDTGTAVYWYPILGGFYAGIDTGPLPSSLPAPTGLVASVVSNSRIDLSWIDASSNETGIRIMRKTEGGGLWATIAGVSSNATAYSDTGLVPATLYYYRVAATNATEESVNSSEASGTTQNPPADAGGVTKIRYYPRVGLPERMLLGVFEGSNGDMTNGPYTQLRTVSVTPADNQWTETQAIVDFDTRYRYLRYRGPGSQGDVAEIEFYHGATKLSGVVFGTPGSFAGNGNDYTMAFDGNTATEVNWTNVGQFFVGIDTGLAPVGGTVILLR